jgi:hypothetical protein
LLLCAAVCVVLSFFAVPAVAADTRLQRYVIAAGGGQSSAGNFQVTGTIGQPAVALLTGGNFVLQGGFWEGGAAPPTVFHSLYLPVMLKRY